MKISIVNTSVACLREKLAKGIGLPFAQLLPESFLEKVLAEEKVNYRKRLFCPIVTLWAWTSQVLDADKSCKNALSRVISYLIAEELEPPSTNTSAYCQARSRSFTCFLSRLVRRIGNHLHSCVQSGWLWCGLKVFVVDGSTLQAADTVKNQKAYPQHKSQAKGCGFPMVRIVVRFCLSTGAVLDTAISAFSVGEVNLFRRLFANLQAGSRATGDRIFGTYADICLLKNRCVESAFRRHGARKTDFRRGKRLSKWDHLVHWEKPSRCPTGLSKKQFDLLPTQLLMREVRFYIQRRGFRTEDVTLVTT